jgi:A/G-specific adenine glycosylase
MWRGLGYYRRARSLLAGAKTVMGDKKYHGRLPDNVQRMEKEIDGVGRYTAGAICSMAYGIRTPIVIWLSLSVAQLILQIDGNVHRLFTRLLGIHASQVAPQTTKALWAAASDLIEGLPVDEARRGIAGDWNQVCPHTCKQSSTTLTPTGANGARKPSLQARWTRLCWMSATEKL